MHVLVTGASSFLGRHIAMHLVRAGHQVTGTYRNDHPSLAPLRAAQVALAPLDLADAESYGVLPLSIDAVVHVAGVSIAPGVSLDDMLACNVTGSRNILRYALSAGVAKLIYTSTMSIYGEIDVDVVKETTPIVAPDVYGASKLLAERMFAEASDRLPCIAVRLPGVLGIGAHRAWLPTILERIQAGQGITIYNPENLFNNAAHVDDLGPFFGRVLSQRWGGFHAFPVGAGGSMTVAGAIDRLMRAVDKPVPVKIGNALQRGFTISSDYAVLTFGYEPTDIGAMLDRYAFQSRSIVPALQSMGGSTR
jgi:nucleoside-diphosphate-sugar epimerase